MVRRSSENLLNLPERNSTKTLLFCFTRRFDDKTSFDRILESPFSEGTRDPTLYSSSLPLEVLSFVGNIKGTKDSEILKLSDVFSG